MSYRHGLLQEQRESPVSDSHCSLTEDCITQNMAIMPHPQDEYEDSETRSHWYTGNNQYHHQASHRDEYWDPYSQRTDYHPPPEHPVSYPRAGPKPIPFAPSLEPIGPPPLHMMQARMYQRFHSPPIFPASSHQYPPPVIFAREEVSVPHHSPRNDVVYEVHPDDVLCGRGAPTSWHAGNKYFRQLVTYYQPAYLAARRADKPEIALKVVHTITKERRGRFLKRTKMHGAGPSGHFCWQDIGENRAYEKACQALREGAPEIRRQMMAVQSHKREHQRKSDSAHGDDADQNQSVALIVPSKDERDDNED